MNRTTEYATFTITHVGKNDFGNVYALYSKLLECVFGDISKSKKDHEYEIRLYVSIALSLSGMKSIVEFIELINKGD